jgi:hypothetical protein
VPSLSLSSGIYNGVVDTVSLTANRAYTLPDRDGILTILPSDLYDTTRHNILTGTPAQARAEIMGAAGAEIAAAGTVAEAAGALGCVTKTKSLNTSKTNDATTLTNAATNDPELSGFAVKANTNYEVLISLKYTTTTNCGIKIGFYSPSFANATNSVLGIFYPASGSLQSHTIVATNNTQSATTAAATATSGFIHAIFRTGSTPGNVVLRWAQNTAHADTLTVHADTFMTIRELP